MLWKLVTVLAMLCVMGHSNAQLVYVKCCMKNDYDRYCFGPALTGPQRDCSYLPSYGLCRVSWKQFCIYGFGSIPDSIALQERLCSDFLPDLIPDQADCTCTEWQDFSTEIVYSCRGSGGAGNIYHVIYDYDGDGDLDLRDYARFQNEFEPEP